MKNGERWQSVMSIVIILTLLIGVWKGEELVSSLQDNVSVTDENVARAAGSSSEMRAVWISYLDLESAGVSKMSKTKFEKYIDKMFNNCVNMRMNTVIVQVRPFGDALYKSSYFPWSSVVSGKQGKSPGYDPLAYMVKAAHKHNLEIHAWINPYRVTMGSTKKSTLSSDNQALKWMKSGNSSTRRNVLNFGGQYYFNPSKSSVRKLIVNGVKEIVKNYDVDGIHFDDYFYPTLGANYKKNFDAKEYKAYKKACKKAGKSPASIVTWRRENVNKLLRSVYTSIKKIDKKVSFGVSPAGNINNLYGQDRYYCDVKKWMSKTGYVDYVCPQVYWSFKHKVCPYTATVKKWASLKKSSKVKLYIGLAAYRAGISKSEAKKIGDIGWATSKKELQKQVVSARKVKNVSGFMFFRYGNMISSKSKKEITNLKKVLK